jgi:hypothetical protein
MNIPDPIYENLVSGFFGLKVLKFFDADKDPASGIRHLVNTGSGMQNNRIRDSKSKYSEPATMIQKLPSNKDITD